MALLNSRQVFFSLLCSTIRSVC